MILVDYNQVMLASLFASIGNHHNVELDENLLRHMFLNSIRFNRKKFTEEFGEIVLCVDTRDVWRRDYFPYYKANRKKSRDESELDWTQLFGIMNTIRDELKEFFPYKVIHMDHLEADDIIGTIVHKCILDSLLFFKTSHAHSCVVSIIGINTKKTSTHSP